MSTSCPGCDAPLTGASPCPSCGLPLVGPDAGRLWQVDQELVAVDNRRASLVAERERLLLALRSGRPGAASDPFVVTSPAVGGRPVWTGDFPAGPPPLPRKEANPKQVQNTLLALGALLLAVAGIVFAAVTYRALGPAGRAVILIALTAMAGLAPQRLVQRGLGASAEALAAVALVLAALDAWALRRAGLAADTEALSYSAVATGLLALAAGGYAVVVPLRVTRVTTVLLAQLPVALVLARVEPSLPVVAVTLAAVAAVDLLAVWEKRLPDDTRATAALAAAVNLAVSLMATVGAIRQDDDGAGLGLLAVAIVLAATSSQVSDLALRALLSGASIPLAAGAAWVTARPSLTHDQRPLVLAAVALLALTTSGMLPFRHRAGPVLGSLAVAAGAIATQAEPILVAVAGPFTWLSDPWTLDATSARAAVSLDEPWSGTVITLVVLGVAAVCTVMAGLLLERAGQSVLPTGGVLALALAVLPLGLSMSYALALAVLVLFAAGLAGGAWFTSGVQRIALLLGAGSLATIAAAWSTADRDATLLVLPALSLLAAVTAIRVPATTAAAALLGGAALSAFGADAGLDRAEVSVLLLVAPAACVGLSLALRLTYRLALEGAALVLAAASVVLAVEDLTALSVSLGVSGVLALAVAIRPDRHDVALLGGLLLTASSWVRLADADVEAPEPYAAPLAITALAFGHLRRRKNSASSFEAYGAGLSVALVPTLLRSFADESPARGLALLVVCVLLVLAGGAYRLQAPLAIGGLVLVLDVLHLMAPVAHALPRWSLFALAGAVLVGVGISYEQRRRDLARLKERYDQLS